jgi:two-component system nitrogen regulation response regulator NtrX
MVADILIVDDEDDIRDLVAGILEDEGHSARLARDSDEAIAAIDARRPQLILLDIWMQGSKLDGLQLLEAIKRRHPNVPVVMISGHGNIETAVTAIKLGAYDFIEKPFKADRLILIAERALETSRLKREVHDLRARGGSVNRMIGSSAAVVNLKRIIEKLGPSNSRVLISGAAGSGKELAARLIHECSARADGPFVVINAPAMSPEGMEAELFGVEAGAVGSPRIGAL